MNLSGRGEFLTGVFVGLYANWLITISNEFYGNSVTSLSSSLFWFSFLPFLAYFLELTSRNQWQIGYVRFQNILGILHISMVSIALFTSEIITTKYLFVIQGFAFWIIIMYVSQR